MSAAKSLCGTLLPSRSSSVVCAISLSPLPRTCRSWLCRWPFLHARHEGLNTLLPEVLQRITLEHTEIANATLYVRHLWRDCQQVITPSAIQLTFVIEPASQSP